MRRIKKGLGGKALELGSVSLTLCFGVLAHSGNVLQATDYTASGLSTYLEGPSDLELENIQIVQETTLSDGRVLLVVEAAVRNLEEQFWDSLSAGLVQGVGAAWQYLADPFLSFTGVDPLSAIEAGNDAMHLVVSAADLAAAQAAILAGNAFEVLVTLSDGTELLNPPEITLDPRLTDVIELVDGQFVINVGLTILNGLEEYVAHMVVSLAGGIIEWTWETTSPTLRYDNPPAAYGVAAPTEYLTTVVEPEELESARASILGGGALTARAHELWVYNAPPKGIDEVTFEAYQGSSGGDLVFTEETPFLQALQPGDLILSNPRIYQVPSLSEDGENQGMADLFPFQVTGLIEHEGIFYVSGQRRELLEVLKSATFIQSARDAYEFPIRDPYDPDLENTYTDQEMEEREEAAKFIERENPRDGRLADLRGLSSIPWHFNDKFLTDNIKVSGQVLIRSSGLRLELKIRNFALKRALAHLDAGVEINMVMESGEREDLSTDIVEELIDALRLSQRVPPIPLNIGGIPVTLRPVMYFNVGAEADIPQRFSLPIQTAFTVGLDMGWDSDRAGEEGDGFFYEFSDAFIPLRVADPTLFDDLAATVGFWAEFGVGLEGTIAGSLNVSPTLALRLQNDFTVAPFGNPWWSVSAHGNLVGRFAIDFLGMVVVDNEASLYPFDLYSFDAGGPLIPAGGISVRDGQSGGSLASLSGGNVRWARAYHSASTSGLMSNAWVLPEVGDEVVVAVQQSLRNYLLKYDLFGNRLWAYDFPSIFTLRTAYRQANNDMTMAGYYSSEIWVGTFDPDANRRWVTAWRPEKSFTIESACAGPAVGSSEPSIMLAGHIHHGSIGSSDPTVAAFDANGQLLWSKYYAFEGDDEVNEIIPTRDGGFVLCGYTNADVAPPPIGIPASNNVLKNANSNGLLMKIDASGNLLWATAFVSPWGIDLHGVAEGPDGTLYTTGGMLRPVNRTGPAAIVARFTPDGELKDHVTIGTDPDWPDEFNGRGNTSYDAGHGIKYTEEGLWICGTTGLGEATAGWVASLTDELGVRFFTGFDGSLQEGFFDLADTGSGLLVVGQSRSLMPWGSGGSYAALTMHLPFEGVMRFDDGSHLESRYLQARIRKRSSEQDFAIISEVPSLPPQTYSNLASPVPFEVTDLALQPVDRSFDLVPSPTPSEIVLDHIEPGRIGDYDDWTVFHRLTDPDLGLDSDGDGLPNGLEAFFGRDPHVYETTPPLSISHGQLDGLPVLVIDFERSTYSQSLAVVFQSSEDLDTWLTANGIIEEVQPLSAELEQVRFIAYHEVPTRFFRFLVSLAGAENSAGMQ